MTRIDPGERIWIVMKFPPTMSSDRAKTIIDHIGTRATYYGDNVNEEHYIVVETVSDDYYGVKELTRKNAFNKYLFIYKNRFSPGKPTVVLDNGRPVVSLGKVVDDINRYIGILYGVEIAPIDEVVNVSYNSGAEEKHVVHPLKVVLIRDNVVRLLYLGLVFDRVGLDGLRKLCELYAAALLDEESECIDIPYGDERLLIEYIIGWTLYYITGSIGAVRDMLNDISMLYCDGIVSDYTERIVAMIKHGPPKHSVLETIRKNIGLRQALEIRSVLMKALGKTEGSVDEVS